MATEAYYAAEAVSPWLSIYRFQLPVGNCYGEAALCRSVPLEMQCIYNRQCFSPLQKSGNGSQPFSNICEPASHRSIINLSKTDWLVCQCGLSVHQPKPAAFARANIGKGFVLYIHVEIASSRLVLSAYMDLQVTYSFMLLVLKTTSLNET